jgi:GT2 family glycosyltransferase
VNLSLSIVIVSYDCLSHLRRCLESIEGARGDLEVEVLVVDNASTDGTPEMVRGEFPWVDFTPAGGNLGFARANNLVLPRARGERILLLNPDTILPAGSLPRLVAALDAHPEAGMLGCKLVRPDGVLDHACKRGFPSPLAAVGYFTRLDRLGIGRFGLGHYAGAGLDEDDTGPVDAVNGAFMLVRPEAVREVGLLDERFWMYGEDLDWCYRFWQAGWQVLYWPEVTVVHVKGASSSQRRRWRTNLEFHRAMWLFYDLHLAPQRNPAMNGLVWIGVWLKLAFSATRSGAARGLSRAQDFVANPG